MKTKNRTALILLALICFVILQPPVNIGALEGLSAIIGPQKNEVIDSLPVKIIVHFGPCARPETFKAKLNGRNITEKFTSFEDGVHAFVNTGDGLRLVGDTLPGKRANQNKLKTRIYGSLDGGCPSRGADVDVVHFLVRPDPTVTVPDLVGMSPSNAETACLAAGLVTGEIGTAPSMDQPPDIVLSQEPAAGTVVDPMTPVNLVVSELTLISLTVTPEELLLTNLGQSEQLILTGAYNDCTTADLTPGATGTVYLPSGRSVISDGDGVLTAVQDGYTGVDIIHGGLTAYVGVEVILPPVPPATEALDGVAVLSGIFGDLVTARWNPANGSLWNLINFDGELSVPATGNPLDIARSFLLTHPGIFGLDAAELDEFIVETNYTNNSNGTTHIVFRQRYNGLKFFDGSIQVNVDPEGRITSVGGDYEPDPVYPSLVLGLTATEAVLTVADRLEPQTVFTPLTTSGPEGVEMLTIFDPGPFPDSPFASLTWALYPDMVRLAWWVTLPGNTGTYHALVDGHSGELLQIIPAAVAAADIQGLVFPESPDRGPQIPKTFPGDWSKSPDPTPEQVNNSPYDSSGNNAVVAWIKQSVSGAWTIDTQEDYQYVYQGYALGCPGVGCLVEEDPDTGFYETDAQVAVTNAFYWVNSMHDYFYDLGFDRVSGNFEKVDDSSGAEVNMEIFTFINSKNADVQKYIGVFRWIKGAENEENMASWKPQILLESLPRSGALARDMIIHEYTHGVTSTLVNGPEDRFGLPGNELIPRILAEGFSDFFAASVTNDPIIGEWMGNSESGLRIFRMDKCSYIFEKPLEECPTNYQFMPNLFRKSHAAGHNGVYGSSLVWSSTLWHLREVFMNRFGGEAGRLSLERLILDGTREVNHRSPHLLMMRDAIIDANGKSVNPVPSIIWQVFADHGMGYSAQSPVVTADRMTHPAYDLPPPRVETVETVQDLEAAVPIDFDIAGEYFDDISRVAVRHSQSGSEDFPAFERVDHELILLEGYVFLHEGEYKICVESEYDEEWRGQCALVDVGDHLPPAIALITPSAGIPTGEPVNFEISGSDFLDVQAVTVIEPDGTETPATFTVLDNNLITIDSFIFSLEGEHTIRIASFWGQDESVVLVENPAAEVLWAMRGGVAANWIGEAYNDGRIVTTPDPILGLTSVSESLDYGGSITLNAFLPTPVGVEQRQNSVDVIQISGSVTGAPYMVDPSFATFDGAGFVHFQEVIRIEGAELPDGTVITEGSIPCHLELNGTVFTYGPLYDYGHASGYCFRVYAALLPDGFSVVDPCIWESPDYDAGLDRLTELFLAYNSNYDVAPFPDPYALSPSFDLLLSSNLILYNDFSNFFAGSYFDVTSIDLSASVSLVSDDPGVKLIYRK